MLLCSCSAPKKKENNDTGGKNDTEEDIKKPLTYTIYAGGGYDNVLIGDASESGRKFASAFDLEIGDFTNRTKFIDEEAEKEITFTIDGKEYDFTYLRSYASKYFGKTEGIMKDLGACDDYESGDITIEIRPETNVIVDFFDKSVDTKAKGDYTEEQARERAESLFKELYGEEYLEDYRLDKLIIGSKITIIFRRYVHGYGTMDSIGFLLNLKGELMFIGADNAFMLADAEDKVNKEDMEAAEKVLRESIGDDWNIISSKGHLTRDNKGTIYLFVTATNEKFAGAENYEQEFYINVN
jgi:hypothetical protein